MNQKKAKELRRKAHNEWLKLKPDARKVISEIMVYKHLKKELKNVK